MTNICEKCGSKLTRSQIHFEGFRTLCAECKRACGAAEPDKDQKTSKVGDPDSDALESLADLASRQRTARIVYRKPGERAPTTRLVEPYRLEASSAEEMVLCWQLHPKVEDRMPWRHFRLDRIESVADGGSNFTPRAPVTLHLGDVVDFQYGHHPVVGLGPRQEYLDCIESALSDAIFDQDEFEQARSLALCLSDPERRGVHCQVFVNILQEMLADGEIGDREAAYLRSVRKVLELLGWAP